MQNNRKRKAHKQLLKIIINSFSVQLLLSGAKYFNFSVCIIIMLAQRLFESRNKMCTMFIHKFYIHKFTYFPPCNFCNIFFSFTACTCFSSSIQFQRHALKFYSLKKESCIKARIWENEAMRLFQNRSCI